MRAKKARQPLKGNAGPFFAGGLFRRFGKLERSTTEGFYPGKKVGVTGCEREAGETPWRPR
jgi:hypothetical protein